MKWPKSEEKGTAAEAALEFVKSGNYCWVGTGSNG